MAHVELLEDIFQMSLSADFAAASWENKLHKLLGDTILSVKNAGKSLAADSTLY